MAISKTARTLLTIGLAAGPFVTAILGQPAECSAVKQNAVSACTVQCGDVGQCIFGCEIGQVDNFSQCNLDCAGLGDLCLNSCNTVVQEITSGCSQTSNVTPSVAINLGTIFYNRATGVWQQTVVVTNTSGGVLNNLGYILDSLNSGWTLTNGDGITSALMPQGSSYKNFGSLAANAAVAITLQFSRTGTPLFGYSPRVLSGTAR